MATVRIFTDGACRGNPGAGGWAAILQCADGRVDGEAVSEKKLCGAQMHTTNNRMELIAAIEALAALRRPCTVELTTDSEYVRRGITEWIRAWKRRGWTLANRQPVKNVDLWRRLDTENARHDVRWHWVRGHSGHPGNEAADRLANAAIDDMLRQQA